MSELLSRNWSGTLIYCFNCDTPDFRTAKMKTFCYHAVEEKESSNLTTTSCYCYQPGIIILHQIVLCQPKYRVVLPAPTLRSAHPVSLSPLMVSRPLSPAKTPTALMPQSARPALLPGRQSRRDLVLPLVKGMLQIAIGGVLGGLTVLKMVDQPFYNPASSFVSRLSNLAGHEFENSLGESGEVTEADLQTFVIRATPAPENPPGPSSVNLPLPTSTAIAPAAAPAPVFVDRFYIPNPTAPTNQNQPVNSMVVVDRFYWPSQGNPPNSVPANPPVATAPQPAAYLGAVVPVAPIEGGSSVSGMFPGSASAVTSDSGGSESNNSPTGYTLLGILELGPQSTALFSKGESTYSVSLGQAIGNSPWILTKFSEGKAILRQGNETRSVTVGEAF